MIHKGILRIIVFSILFTAFVIYSSFVYTTGTHTSEITLNSTALHGKLLFQKHNCTACHQLYGLGGFLGPELTTVMSQNGKGEAYTKTFLKTGTPRMPNFHLSDEEITEMVEYLRIVDSTAVTYK